MASQSQYSGSRNSQLKSTAQKAGRNPHNTGERAEVVPELDLDAERDPWGAILGALLGLGLAAAGVAVGVGVTGVAGNTQSFWYLSRAAGFVAYALLWGSMVWGLLLSSKIGQGKIRPPVLLDAHEFLSDVGLGFAFFHGLVLMGDRFLSFPLGAVLVPFASTYRPFLVAIGQIGLWFSLAVTLSFLVRKRIGQRRWRQFHYVSFVAYWLVLGHAALLGTDSKLLLVQLFYLFTAGPVIFLTLYRILSGRGTRSKSAAAQSSSRVSGGPTAERSQVPLHTENEPMTGVVEYEYATRADPAGR